MDNLLSNEPISVFWFRRDLRLDDNHGLYQALKGHRKVLAVFIFDTSILNHLEDKADKRVEGIHQRLQLLKQQLNECGSDLRIQVGTAESCWEQWMSEFSIEAVYCNHDYEPKAMQRDEHIRYILNKKGISFYTFKDQCLFERNEIVKDDGLPYTVYTPYSKRWKKQMIETGIPNYPSEHHQSNFIRVQQPGRMPELSEIGFTSAGFKLPEITYSAMSQYDRNRDFPGIEGTTRMGFALRFGCLSIRKMIAEARLQNDVFLNQLIWREFFMQILWHFPHVVEKPFKSGYERIVWDNNEQHFKAWCEGRTGVAIVDAGMRELNATGYMHNRVRMITASYLCKHLLIDWRWGEAYFAQKLLDFDLSANNGSWQWVAGCGTDAAPYFRVFNPIIQHEKFDPQNQYVKQWVPEWNTLTYTKPLVEHVFARDRCLLAYKTALEQSDKR